MKTAIALGNFDGVHIAHRKIIENTVKHSNEHGLKSVVYTFETHPRQVLSGSFFTIMQNSVKQEIIKDLGADEVYFETTTPEILSMEPEEFVSKILVKKFNVLYVSAGYDYTFGINGRGDTKELKRLGEKFGFVVDILDEIKYKGISVSSTLIREYIKNGQTDKVAEISCTPYTIRGVVEHGSCVGTKLGFKTANILPPENIFIPKNGVYKTEIKLDNKVYKAITNVGVKPTFGEGRVIIESHVIDFNGDLYGKTLDVLFGKRIRDEKKFESCGELSEQIKEDIKMAFQL